MKKKELKFWLIESYSGWFIVKASCLTKAWKAGIHEYGRNALKSVGIAKDGDVRSYVAHKGQDAIEELV